MMKTAEQAPAPSGRNTPPWRKRAEWLWRAYRITLAEYEAMWLWQGGRCDICRGTNPSGHSLAVDHDHTTGSTRALLCVSCNADIGLLENEERVSMLRGYLVRFS